MRPNPQELARITGSKAYERFTGSQISKIFHTKRDAFNATEVYLTILMESISRFLFFI